MMKDVKVVGLLAVSALLFAGCGGAATYPAGGSVKYKDGSPLPGAMVEFRCGEGDAIINARGEVQQDGAFTLTTFEDGDGTVAGAHQAIVLPPVSDAPSNMSAAPPKPPLAFRFSKYETSKLEFTVNPSGDNKFEIIVAKPTRGDP